MSTVKEKDLSRLSPRFENPSHEGTGMSSNLNLTSGADHDAVESTQIPITPDCLADYEVDSSKIIRSSVSAEPILTDLDPLIVRLVPQNGEA